MTFGAPGVYPIPDELRRTLGNERMDVCAFVGVAPRGPCRVPAEPDQPDEHTVYVEASRERRSQAIAVESWDQYLHIFGGFDGPGRLPYAVANFFEQGGCRAYVVRVVHDYGGVDDLGAVASHRLEGVVSTVDIVLAARNEGAWGNHLRAAWMFKRSVVEVLFDQSSNSTLVLADRQSITIGSLLHLSSDSFNERRFVTRVWRAGAASLADSFWFVSVDGPALPSRADSVHLITGRLLVRDDATGFEEQYNEVGLSPEHPRFLANLLYRDSTLLYPIESWLSSTIVPVDQQINDVDLRVQMHSPSTRFSGGFDRYEDIVADDFFDRSWVLSDPRPGNGIHALTHLSDLSMLVTPDLYVPEALPAFEEIDEVGLLSNAEFSQCVTTVEPPVETNPRTFAMPRLMLDPSSATDLAAITALQRRVVEFAELHREFIALLDVPPGLRPEAVMRWRSTFSSAFAAAYLPWLQISTLDDERDALVSLNPATVAAGIIARQEHDFGLPHGPANAIASAIVATDETISKARHDSIHPMGLNVFLQERQGVRLSAARTLSREGQWRQLSVVRLMVMIKRVLRRQMQWVVFEPNEPKLWSDLRFKLEAFLRQLFIGGAFRGNTEAEAFFVRCDEELNNQRVLDAGKLLVEIGVAPAEPLEFIVVRITREGDGTLTVES